MADVTNLSFSIDWSEDDQCYIFSAPQLPGCLTDGKTIDEALKNGVEAVTGYLEMTLQVKNDH